MLKSQYQTEIRSINDLDIEIQHAICGLYLSYYDGSNTHQVLEDLSNKNDILLLYFDHALVGFTTIQIYDCLWGGQTIRIVYSGDTIVAREHWGQQALAHTWISHIAKIKSEKPEIPLYWFVIIKGHRTFKFLPTFGRSFYPHWSIHREDLKALADKLATDKFGSFYNQKTGIVEFNESRGHLKSDIAYPTTEEMQKEPVSYFIKKNPNYLQGHELVCLCELEEHNMKPITKRIYMKAYNDQVMEATV